MSLAWVVPMGLLVGIALGSLGAGGSILAVPALVYLLGQSPSAATAGSLVIVGTSALVGMTSHWRAGRVHVVEGLVFGALGVGGSALGSRLSGLLPAPVLLTAFAGLMLVVAWLMQARVRRPAAEPAAMSVPGQAQALGLAAASGPAEAPGPAEASGPAHALARTRAHARTHATGRTQARTRSGELRQPAPSRSWARILAAATGVGLLTGFFGVGGGFAVVPALVLALRMPMPVAVGTSLLVIAINSTTALIARAAGGIGIDWQVVGWFSVFAVLGSLAGSVVARRTPARALTQTFVVLLVLVAGYLLVANVPLL